MVGRLGCLRGVGVLTGFGLAVEIGDWQGFTGATIGAWLGLVPSQQSSGGRRTQGAITKTGNSHADGCCRGGLAPPQAYRPASSYGPATPASPPRSGNAPTAATAGSTSAGVGWMLVASAPPSAWSRAPASSPDGPGAWPSWRPDPGFRAGWWGGTSAAWGATRDTAMSSLADHGWVTLDL